MRQGGSLSIGVQPWEWLLGWDAWLGLLTSIQAVS
jgi:hypothetical protein